MRNGENRGLFRVAWLGFEPLKEAFPTLLCPVIDGTKVANYKSHLEVGDFGCLETLVIGVSSSMGFRLLMSRAKVCIWVLQ